MRRFFLASLLLLQCIPSANTALAQGKKGGGSSTLPNVRFEVRLLGTLPGDVKSSIGGMNELGEIVGTSDDSDSQTLPRAVRFTSDGVVDLNVEMADLLAAREDGPWTASTAADINDLGQIVGTIKVGNSPTVNPTHTFFYDPGDTELGRSRTLDILPLVNGTTTRPIAVNNLGQIVGSYSLPGEAGSFVYSPGGVPIDMGTGISARGINDSGQVVFSVFGYESLRYTPNLILGDAGNWELFPFACNKNSINSFGELIGHTKVLMRKGKYEETAYRATSPTATQMLFRSSSSSVSTLCINDDSDAVVTINGRSSLYTDMNGMGLINLDSLVVGTSEALGKWRENFTPIRAMTNRYPVSATASFPWLAGEAGATNQAVVLIPRLP